MKNEELLLRQQQLIARSAQLRSSVAEQSQLLRHPLAFADKVKDGINWLYHHPTWPVAAVVVLLILKPRRAIIWGSRIWGGWKVMKRLQEAIQKTSQ